jgi:hypothetical protein
MTEHRPPEPSTLFVHAESTDQIVTHLEYCGNSYVVGEESGMPTIRKPDWFKAQGDQIAGRYRLYLGNVACLCGCRSAADKVESPCIRCGGTTLHHVPGCNLPQPESTPGITMDDEGTRMRDEQFLRSTRGVHPMGHILISEGSITVTPGYVDDVDAAIAALATLDNELMREGLDSDSLPRRMVDLSIENLNVLKTYAKKVQVQVPQTVLERFISSDASKDDVKAMRQALIDAYVKE